VTPIQLLLILRARWRLALAIFVLSVAAAAAYTFSQQKEFTGVATVLLDTKAPDPVFGFMVPNGGVVPGYVSTQVDIIRSERVAMQVVQHMHLAENQSARDLWARQGSPGSIEQFFAGLLVRNLDVRPSRESSVIAIVFTATDPAFAANVANAFAAEYIDAASEMRSSTAKTSSDFFDARTRELRTAVEAAQAKLSAYQRSHGITVTDERLDVENMRLNELSAQLTSIQGLRSESASRTAQVRNQLNTSPDVLQSPVVQSLRLDIGRAEGKLHELRGTLGENHPQVVSAKAELRALNDRLQSEMRQVGGSVDASNAVNQQREADIHASLDAQKAKVLQLRAARDEVAVMQHEVEEAQKNLDLASGRLAQTNLDSENRQTTISVLSKALPPFLPSRPRVMFNLMLAVLFGGALGLAAALLREASDRRLRGIDTTALLLDLPILAVLPKSNKRRPKDLTVRRALARLERT
jgi:succinoglycan biosynthesis transport protein ExoP